MKTSLLTGATDSARDPRWAALEKQNTVAVTGATRRDRVAGGADRGDFGATIATGGAWLSVLIPTIATAPVDRLEELQREFVALCSAAAPETWRSTRRSFFRMCRIARREMRARELARRERLERARRAIIGESS